VSLSTPIWTYRYAGVRLHSKIPLVALLGLAHLRIPLPVFVFGGAGRRDQGGLHEHALPHRHAPCAEVCFDGLKNLLAKLVFLQQVSEAQDRGLIGDPVADQLDAGKAAERGHLNQSLFHGRVAERIPLLQEMNPQHRCQRIRWLPAFLAGFGVVGFDQLDQRLRRHHHLHLREKLLQLSLLLGFGDLVIREAKLFAAHQAIPSLRSQGYYPTNGLDFPESPKHF
jgi:hypothetical protein